jgi:type IV secretion system protein VirB3
MEGFLLTKNLLTLLLSVPLHGVFMLLCARDARFFDLLMLWTRTRLPALIANYRVWGAGCIVRPQGSRSDWYRAR